MKATPDVPPALRVLAAEIAEFAESIAEPHRGTNPEDVACMNAQHVRSLGARLEAIAAELEASWKPKP